MAAPEARHPRARSWSISCPASRSWATHTLSLKKSRCRTASSSTKATSRSSLTIKELLETRVRPAVAQDGGDITFRGFKDGTVYLNMKGVVRRLPVLDGNAEARRAEPAAPFRSGSAGSRSRLTAWT
jgi:hypothetical protein